MRRSTLPGNNVNTDYGKLVTVVILRLNFNQVMKGHLVLLSRQLNSGVLGSVAVQRTLFAGNIRPYFRPNYNAIYCP